MIDSTPKSRKSNAKMAPGEPSGGAEEVPTLPAPVGFSGSGQALALQQLSDRARDYAKASRAENTRRAYEADWRHYQTWCRCNGFEAIPPDPQTLGLYITACAFGAGGGAANSVRTIERRLSSLVWQFRQRDLIFDRSDRHVATVLAGIRKAHGRPARQKEAVLPDDLMKMLAVLDHGSLRGMRDRAMLLLGFAGGLRRSEITGLDCKRDQTVDGAGWIEILPKGLLVTLRGKTGWREVEIGRGSTETTCPVAALQTWLKFARIDHGPLFRRVRREGKEVGPDRLNDRQVARLVKQVALSAGVRADLPEKDRAEKFAGHSLRSGLASSAEVEERFVQKQLGHASAEMTRRYQRRRDRFRVNLTKAAGL